MEKNQKTNNQEGAFAIPKENYKIIIAGLVLIIVGFFLMSGGAAPDLNTFQPEEIFSARRITVAPIVCLIGFTVVLLGIIKKPKTA